MARVTARMILLLAMCIAIGGGRADAQAPPAASSTPAANATLSAIEGESLTWFEQLLRIDTSNPPGNELVAAKYIAGILKQEGIPYEIFETTPGRGFIVARLASSPVPDPSQIGSAHL